MPPILARLASLAAKIPPGSISGTFYFAMAAGCLWLFSGNRIVNHVGLEYRGYFTAIGMASCLMFLVHIGKALRHINGDKSHPPRNH